MLKRLALVALMAVACGGSSGASDAGDDTDAGGQTLVDAGQADAGQPDAGQPDAGQSDAGTAACRFTISGEFTASGVCDGVSAIYEVTPNALFVSTGVGINHSPFAMNFSATLAGAMAPASFSDSSSWDFGVSFPGDGGVWFGGFGGVAPEKGSFAVVFTNGGAGQPIGTDDTAYVGTHGTIDGTLPPDNSSSNINVHIDF
jgi:hypothetical protein